MPVLTVTSLNTYVKSRLESDVYLEDIALQAEISNYKHHSSGHRYMTLKDAQSSINAVMFSAELNRVGVPSVAMSAIKAQNVIDFDKEEANRLIDEGNVIVFGGGYGLPYYSTDTGSAQRAADIGADVILMAKSGVDGVYDSDPDENPDAKKFDELTFDDILRLELKVIDASAAELCLQNGIDAFVFNMAEEGNIVKAAKGDAIGTVIKASKGE